MLLILGIDAHDRTHRHRHDEQVAIARPSQPTGLAVDVGHGAHRAVGVDGEHPSGTFLGQPQLALVPTRALGKCQTLADDLESGRHNSVY